MKLLLDTHAFIWWDGDQTRLSEKVLTECLTPANSIHLSLVSVWELQIKIHLGKLALRLSLADVLEDQQHNGLILEGVSVDDVLALSDLPMLHRDPFDRLLIAQARRSGFSLVSHDSQIAGYDVTILW